MHVVTMVEIEEVTGGLVPLGVALFYAAGGTAGVSAGWALGRAFFCSK